MSLGIKSNSISGLLCWNNLDSYNTEMNTAQRVQTEFKLMWLEPVKNNKVTKS